MTVFIFQMISVLEVIFVNLALFHANAKPRYVKKFIVITLLLFTCLIVPLGVFVMKALGIYGNGNALFTLFGFLYLFPLHYLYKGPMIKKFFIICFSWVYTLLVCSLSIQVGIVLEFLGRHYVILATETLLFLVSCRYIFYFTKRVYLPLSKIKGQKLNYYLNRASLVWFCTVLIVNLQFVYGENHYLKIVAMLMICMNVLYNFELIKEILRKERQIGSLENQVAMDFLTNTGNRLGFKNVFYEKAARNKEFSIVYLDLNNFKYINDTYGHTAGDVYLQEFSLRLKEIAGENNVFRISGDEFAAFTNDEMVDIVLKKIQRMNFIIGRERIRFNGVSYGVVKYPDEGVEYHLLMDMADKKMYDMKVNAN